MALPLAWDLIPAADVLEGKRADEQLFEQFAARDYTNTEKPIDLAFAQHTDAGGAAQVVTLDRDGDSLLGGGRALRWIPPDAGFLRFKAEVYADSADATGHLRLEVRLPETGESITTSMTIIFDGVNEPSYTFKAVSGKIMNSQATVRPQEIWLNITLSRISGSGTVYARALGPYSFTYGAET